jgi:hypothetical protein
MSADIFMDAVQLGGAMALCYSVLMIGRGIASRIAGDNASLVLGMSLVSISFATPLPRLREENNQAESNETENAETPENSGNTTVSTVSEYMAVSDAGTRSMVKRMTAEERQELLLTRNNAIGLLAHCIDYYKSGNKIDDGRIPRYNHIKMGAKQRQEICRTLEYSGLLSIVQGDKTIVVPEHEGVRIGTCEALMKLIIANQKRVYPVGYCERGKDLLDSAVMGLPEVEA